MALPEPTATLSPNAPATRADLDLLRADLLREMADLEARLPWRLLGGIGALLALFRLLDLLPPA